MNKFREVLRATLVAAVLVGSGLAYVGAASAHCQVPCGIYDDHARVHQMLEDATTIAKAIDQIRSLAGKTDATSANQLARWVATKEAHATTIQHTVADYFLAQRVKAPAETSGDEWNAYAKKLAQHHAIIVAAMKAKQDANPDTAKALRDAINAIAGYYPGDEKHEH